MKRLKAIGLGVGLSTFASFTTDARADATADCVSASEKGQQLRDDHKLLEAREQFLACARDTCPGAVKKDCADQVAEVDKRTPSVVVHAKDANGQDLVAVHVTSDGKPLTDQLTGQAVPLNPGAHTFHFEAPGNPAVDRQVVLSEGQKDREVSVVLGTPSGGVVGPPQKKGAPIGGIVLGIVGLVGMGVGSAFYISGFNEKSANQSATGCAPSGGTPNCSNSEIHNIRTQLIAGDIAFYTGAAFLGVGLIWIIVHYASGPGHKEGSQAASFDVAPSLGRGATATATLHF